MSARVFMSILAGACWIAGAVQASEPSQIAAGHRVAERSCGGCHAVGAGKSPLPEAPPFATLYMRYPQGGLDALLSEGMLPSSRSQEEGRKPSHWRMETIAMDGDEVASLTAYLRSLEPPPSRPAAGR